MYNSTMFHSNFTTLTQQQQHQQQQIQYQTSPYDYESSYNNNNNNNSNSDSPTEEYTRHPHLDDSLIIDERKQRRMISNRESARRSRMRKQKHLDELWSQVTRLRNENRSLIDRLNHVNECCENVVKENVKIKEENCDLRQMLTTFQICNGNGSPCNNNSLLLRDFEVDVDAQVRFCEFNVDDCSSQSITSSTDFLN